MFIELLCTSLERQAYLEVSLPCLHLAPLYHAGNNRRTTQLQIRGRGGRGRGPRGGRGRESTGGRGRGSRGRGYDNLLFNTETINIYL